jgi:hypothetical protein
MSIDLRLEDIMSEYRFTQIINTPWKELSAYKFGIIDQSGKILKTRRDLIEVAEKNAYPDKFFTLTWSVKRLLEKFHQTPNSSSSLIKTIWNLKTEYGGINPNKYESIIEEYFAKSGISVQVFLQKENNFLESGVYSIFGKKHKIKTANQIGEVFGIPVYKTEKTIFTYSEAKKISEDGVVAAPANNVGGGQMAGVSPGQEPPMPKSTSSQKRKRLQRRQQDRIAQDIKSINIIK